MIMQSVDDTTHDSLANWDDFQETMAQPSVWRPRAGTLADQAATISAWVRARHHNEIWYCCTGTSSQFLGLDVDIPFLNGAVWRGVEGQAFCPHEGG